MSPPTAAPTEVATYGSKWVDQVAAHESGLRAAAVGKAVHVLDGKGAALKSLAHPSTVTGIAFDAKGKRIAASALQRCLAVVRRREGKQPRGCWNGRAATPAW